MLTLALETSTMQPSLALFRGAELIAERTWAEEGRGGRRLFGELQSLVAASEASLAEIGRYVCGRGPGIFSNLRMALTAVRAAALPGQAEVYALSSGEALAWEWIVHCQAERVGVVGDARRGAFWLGLFERQNEAPVCVEDWRLVAPDSFAAAVGPDSLLVTSDLERVVALWKSQQPQAGPAPALTAAVPKARHLGACAMHRIAEGIPSEALEPLYMHPAVDPPKVHASG